MWEQIFQNGSKVTDMNYESNADTIERRNEQRLSGGDDLTSEKLWHFKRKGMQIVA